MTRVPLRVPSWVLCRDPRTFSDQREEYPEMGAWKTQCGEMSGDMRHGSFCVIDGSTLLG